ncbi:hypothetical protein PIB30_019302 [Stylosanthes scabra]|uniref:GIR1-like zinc ribbon domain-containing protein n=1 Tax=Stylosanthes scabra TaxID=79078 RepID=A0ABU6V738_9FABA|nr:hypothetical protein [Stylosanthes scabra]
MGFRNQEMKEERAKSGGELELKLNLSSSPASSMESANASSESEMSCVSSSEANKKEETKPMVLAGCLQCLMYVLLSGVDPNPKCPNCNSTVLLDILKNEQQNNNNKKKPLP